MSEEGIVNIVEVYNKSDCQFSFTSYLVDITGRKISMVRLP